MPDDKLQQLLQTADESAAEPQYKTVSLTSLVHRRARKRRIKIIISPIAAAFLILSGLCFYTFTKNPRQKPLTPEQIASINAQIKDLNTRIDATLSFVQEVIAQQKAQERLDELNAELASIPDPIEEMNKKIEKTAFILLYYADKAYEEFRNVEDAEIAYSRVVELFPQTRSSEKAKERLEKIRNNPVNKEKLNI